VTGHQPAHENEWKRRRRSEQGEAVEAGDVTVPDHLKMIHHEVTKNTKRLFADLNIPCFNDSVRGLEKR
jgi:hypothetical protein